MLAVKNIISYLFLCLVGFFLVGCSANYNSIYRSNTLDDGSNIILTDVKQRSIISSRVSSEKEDIKKLRKFCLEPSPDVFSVMSQAFSIDGSFGKKVDPKALEVALKLAFSNSETGSTISRTQTINMLKEMMYRTCERAMNGMIDDFEVSIIAARDQRIMISILAIEQLTSTLSVKPLPTNQEITDYDKQLEEKRLNTIKTVSTVVDKIVANSFRQEDETAFFCYKVIQKNFDDQVTKNCLDFLKAKIAAEKEEYLKRLEIAKAELKEFSREKFDNFWEKVKKDNKTVDEVKLNSLINKLSSGLSSYKKEELEVLKGKNSKNTLYRSFFNLMTELQDLLSN